MFVGFTGWRYYATDLTQNLSHAPSPVKFAASNSLTCDIFLWDVQAFLVHALISFAFEMRGRPGFGCSSDLKADRELGKFMGLLLG